MLATHDQFTHQMSNRLETTALGLGLVRLLQDARRTKEARATLYSLEYGFQGVIEIPDKPPRKRLKAKVARTAPCLARSA